MIEYVLCTDGGFDLATTTQLADRSPWPQPPAGQVCDRCGQPVRRFDFPSGAQLLHYRAGPPTGHPAYTGEAWRECRP